MTSFFLKRLLPLILLFTVLIYLAFFYRNFYIEKLTQDTKKKYEVLKTEIDELIKDEDNLQKVISFDPNFLNQIFQTYLKDKLLIFLVHDAKGNFTKIFTEQAISKKTLEGVTPYINNTTEILLIDNIQLAFITIDEIPKSSNSPSSTNLRYTFIFDTIDYTTAMKDFYRRFEIFFPLIFLPLIFITLFFITRNKLSLVKDSFIYKNITVFNSLSPSSPASPSLSSISSQPIQQPPPTPPEVSPPENIIPEPKPEPSEPESVEDKLNEYDLIIKEFYLKRHVLDIAPYYDPPQADNNSKDFVKNIYLQVREHKKIVDLNHFHEKKFRKSRLFPATIHGVFETNNLKDYLSLIFQAFIQDFPKSIVLVTEKTKSGYFKVAYASPEESNHHLLDQIKLSPFLGKEKIYFNQELPYIEILENDDEHIVLNFSLLQNRQSNLVQHHDTQHLIKCIFPKKYFTDENKFQLHRWSMFLSIGVENFKTYPAKKTEIEGWYRKDYFLHLLKTYFFDLSKFLDEQEIPQKIIKFVLTKQSPPQQIDDKVMLSLKENLSKNYAKISPMVFAFQKETQIIWILSFNSKITQTNSKIPDTIEKSLSSNIKDYLVQLSHIRKTDLRVSVSSVTFPKNIEEWNELEKNRTFWKSSV